MRHMDDSDLDYEHEAEEATRKRKRRKTASNAERERQKTLTQIDFFEVADSEGAEEDMEDAEIDAPPEPEPFNVWESGSQGSMNQENAEPANDIVGSFESLAPIKKSSSPLGHFKDLSPPANSKGLSAFSTPRKQMKTEVPSSQSPANTPLSTQGTPSKTERTPLQEIAPNVLAMRDQASPSPSKKQGKQLSEREDSPEDGLENLDPDSDGETGGTCGFHQRDALNKSSRRSPLWETHTHDFAASTGVSGPQSGRFNETLRNLAGPSASHSRNSLGNPPQPTAQSRPLTITSSMATTVDSTPASPRQPVVQEYPLPPSSGCIPSDNQSCPPRNPFSFDTEGSPLPSQLPEDVTPAASINGTSEIETYSGMQSDSSDD